MFHIYAAEEPLLVVSAKKCSISYYYTCYNVLTHLRSSKVRYFDAANSWCHYVSNLLPDFRYVRYFSVHSLCMPDICRTIIPCNGSIIRVQKSLFLPFDGASVFERINLSIWRPFKLMHHYDTKSYFSLLLTIIQYMSGSPKALYLCSSFDYLKCAS